MRFNSIYPSSVEVLQNLQNKTRISASKARLFVKLSSLGTSCIENGWRGKQERENLTLSQRGVAKVFDAHIMQIPEKFHGYLDTDFNTASLLYINQMLLYFRIEK